MIVQNEELVGVDFSGRHFGQFLAEASVLRDCDFRRVTIDGGNFGAGTSPTRYVGCRFDGSTLRHIRSGDARFESCTFLDSDLNDMSNTNGEFVGCVFSGQLRAVTFNAAPRTAAGKPHPLRSRNQIEGNDFRRAVLHWTGFRGGVDLSLQHLPAGPEYVLVLNYAAKADAVAAIEAAVPAELLPKARLARQDLEHYAARNNNQIFFRLEDVCGGDATLAEHLTQILRDDPPSAT